MSDVSKDEQRSLGALRKYTTARVALGHTDGSLPTQHLLNFRIDHAKAKDAVGYEFNSRTLAGKLGPLFSGVLQLSSEAHDRAVYLQRPDLGRMLDEPSVKLLDETPPERTDVCIVCADGLSAYAVERNIEPLLFSFIPMLQQNNFSFSPLSLVKGGRVAIGDEIGQRLGSDLVVVCIGERPGLSSTDSLGIYLTYDPKVGRTDESRNCISNIRTGGLHPQLAAEKLLYMIKRSFTLRLSGVQLKDESDPRVLAAEKKLTQ